MRGKYCLYCLSSWPHENLMDQIAEKYRAYLIGQLFRIPITNKLLISRKNHRRSLSWYFLLSKIDSVSPPCTVLLQTQRVHYFTCNGKHKNVKMAMPFFMSNLVMPLWSCGQQLRRQQLWSCGQCHHGHIRILYEPTTSVKNIEETGRHINHTTIQVSKI
jgi:hypothetical protein